MHRIHWKTHLQQLWHWGSMRPEMSGMSSFQVIILYVYFPLFIMTSDFLTTSSSHLPRKSPYWNQHSARNHTLINPLYWPQREKYPSRRSKRHFCRSIGGYFSVELCSWWVPVVVVVNRKSQFWVTFIVATPVTLIALYMDQIMPTSQKIVYHELIVYLGWIKSYGGQLCWITEGKLTPAGSPMARYSVITKNSDIIVSHWTRTC